MFRLIIVDDNKYERNGIQQSIHWQELGIEVVGVFASAFETIKHVDALRPDIIITDISMPGMSGIEMSERILKDHPNIRIIFISCHSNFEYAKSAISLGIHSYVLKPVLSDELLRELHAVIEAYNLQAMQNKEKAMMMQQIETMLPLVQEQLFKDLLLGNVSENDDIYEKMAFLKIHLSTASLIRIISIKLTDLKAQGAANAYFVSYTIKNIIASSAAEVVHCFPVQISATEYAVILMDPTVYDKDVPLDIAVAINQEISRRLGITIIIGISATSTELMDAPFLFKQSVRAVHTMFYSGNNPITYFEDVEDFDENSDEEILNMDSLYQEVRGLIPFGSEQEINGFMEQYLGNERYASNEYYVKSFAFRVVNIIEILLLEVNLSLKDIYIDEAFPWKTLSQFHAVTDVKQWIHHVFKAVAEQMAAKYTSRNAVIVDEMIDFIKNRYSEPISVNDIAKAVFLSARQANNIFKKETGKTIFDYVIDYRMEKAKKLLRQQDSKVNLVAEAVGYTNTSYFCLSFKKMIGISPAEYKKKGIL